MSFFEQESAVAEIEIPREKYIQWLKKHKKGEKIAAKLEFCGKDAQLVIIDDTSHVFKLDQLKVPSQYNLVINNQRQVVAFSAYYAKPKANEDVASLMNQFDKTFKNPEPILEVDSDSDDFRRPDRLILEHRKHIKEPENKQSRNEDFDRNLVRQQIINYARDQDFKEFTIRALREEKFHGMYEDREAQQSDSIHNQGHAQMIYYLITIALASNYLIPSYYGSFEQDFLLRKSILNGDFVSLKWYSRIYANKDSYYAATQNQIYLVSNLDRTLIAGLATPGYRDGDALTSMFLNISSLVYFQLDDTAAAQDKTKTIVVLTNNSTCTTQNQSCIDTQSDPVNAYLIREIQSNVTINATKHDPVLYVVDKDNHCIRIVYLVSGITSTFAGQCGKAGFKDGILGVNLFNQPDQIGVDPQGSVFVYDKGNHFVRIIYSNGTVSTLLNGACRLDVRYTPDQISWPVACLRKWVKTSGSPNTHLITQDYTICTDHFVDCGL